MRHLGDIQLSTDTAVYTSLAFDNNNVPYVVYTDYTNSWKATAMKFNGSNWVNVGSPGFSPSNNSYPVIVINGNNVSPLIF